MSHIEDFLLVLILNKNLQLKSKPVCVWITDASPFKISGEQPSRSNREGAAKDSKETIELYEAFVWIKNLLYSLKTARLWKIR